MSAHASRASSRSVSPALPLKMPSLTRNEAEARTLLARRAQRCNVLLGDTHWQLSIAPAPEGDIAPFGDDDWVVHVHWAGARFALRLPSGSADQWLRARFPSLDWTLLSPEIRSAALEAALHDVTASLEAAGQGPVQLVAMDPEGDDQAVSFAHRFSVALVCGPITTHAAIATDTLGLMLMASVAAQLPRGRGPLPHGAVPVLLRAEIGTATLTRAELSSLEAGDAVMLRQYHVDPKGQLRIGHGHWCMRVRADGAQLVVTERFRSMEGEMEDDYDDEEHENDGLPAEDGNPFDTLPVCLRFDLGQRTLPLSEVEQLQVGEVLELSRPLSRAVTIRANGAVIGSGELVEIGGRLAVSITSIGLRQGQREC